MPAHAARAWTINGRFLGHRVTGVQRYGREILAALDTLVAEGHPLTEHLALEVLAPPGVTDPPVLSAIPLRTVGRSDGPLWEQTALGRHARGGLLSPCNTGCLWRRKQIVCMHDASVWLAPQSYSRGFRAYYRMLLPALGRMAARIVTVSRFSAAELRRHGVARMPAVIANGHEHVLRWRVEAEPPEPRRRVVLIASAARHKNVGLVLGLAGELRRLGLSVALVGRADPRVYGTASMAASDGVEHLGALGDDELASVLSNALCLAFPSLTEGFGLPPLEAMALGCPVVVADRGALPEICGEAALYADPTDPAAWLQAFERLAGDHQLRADLAARGRTRARHFSWRRSAERYLALMAELDGFTPRPTGRTLQEPAARTTPLLDA